jgi:hypothetical protein
MMRGANSKCVSFATLLALALVSAGCSSLGNCPAGQADIVIETGKTVREQGLYYSAPPWGPRDPFPAKTTLHFIHDLGFSPVFHGSTVSFDAEPRDWSENVGNQGRWKCIDDHEVVIENDTCEDFFISITLWGPDDVHNRCSCAQRAAGKCPPLEAGLDGALEAGLDGVLGPLQ